MISHKYKCIFIELPKNASTSITEWLYKNDESTLGSQCDHPYKGMRWQQNKQYRDGHLHTAELRHEYRKYWDDYYKFAVIRNPFERVFSCYSMYVSEAWKRSNGKGELTKHDKRLHEEALSYEGFSDFCKGYLDRITLHVIFQNGDRFSKEKLYHTTHIREQSDWINPTKEWSDDINIIRHENLGKELGDIADTLGIPFDEKDFLTPKAGYFINVKGKSMGDYRDFYDEESIKIVE